ncbi:hypothetical protein [Gemmatimonas sp.]|uniref:hypothetical protein n=1 Tax=Gemmatimonas sp. TaxID=1962908 RepID=UPI00356653EF
MWARPASSCRLEAAGWCRLVPAGDAAAFASLIVALVDDRARVRDAAIRARAFAAPESWDVVWDTLLRDYLQLHRVPAPLSLR